ncbi:MAG: hypothetical protein LBC12_04510 [Nitrososphaerota archaeon]|jgi:transposase-like protein|nr:hypothetical protein [Nitrososphaerota archaeon]
MTSKTPIKCPYCSNDKISKNGHSKAGNQVYNCNNKPAHTKTLQKPTQTKPTNLTYEIKF